MQRIQCADNTNEFRNFSADVILSGERYDSASEHAMTKPSRCIPTSVFHAAVAPHLDTQMWQRQDCPGLSYIRCWSANQLRALQLIRGAFQSGHALQKTRWRPPSGY